MAYHHKFQAQCCDDLGMYSISLTHIHPSITTITHSHYEPTLHPTHPSHLTLLTSYLAHLSPRSLLTSPISHLSPLPLTLIPPLPLPHHFHSLHKCRKLVTLQQYHQLQLKHTKVYTPTTRHIKYVRRRREGRKGEGARREK